MRHAGARAALVALALATAGCQQGSATRTLQLVALNDSGVSGSVSFRGRHAPVRLHNHDGVAGVLIVERSPN